MPERPSPVSRPARTTRRSEIRCRVSALTGVDTLCGRSATGFVQMPPRRKRNSQLCPENPSSASPVFGPRRIMPGTKGCGRREGFQNEVDGIGLCTIRAEIYPCLPAFPVPGAVRRDIPCRLSLILRRRRNRRFPVPAPGGPARGKRHFRVLLLMGDLATVRIFQLQLQRNAGVLFPPELEQRLRKPAPVSA